MGSYFDLGHLNSFYKHAFINFLLNIEFATVFIGDAKHFTHLESRTG